MNTKTRTSTRDLLERPKDNRRKRLRNDINALKWHPMTSYEPVGAVIRVATVDLEYILAYRKEPVSSHGDCGTYYRYCDDTLINSELIEWSHV